GAAAALSVDEIVAIEAIDVARLQPVASERGDGGAEYLGSYVSAKHGVVLALDPATLLQEFSCGDGGLAASGDAPAPAGSATAGERAQFLVYRCGGVTMATALTELEAVMALPKEKVGLGERRDGVTGVCVRFGQPVQLVDLAAKFGLPATAAGGTVVLCIRTESGFQGFLVDRAEALESAVPQAMPWRGAGPRAGAPAFTHMIRVRTADSDRAACVLSLAQVATLAA
ncbi:MAG: chemotaxis protein CheW, partial [Verrucomicrobia bacterium]|nr:chemotaxis protein CheW [Verrucomicrobiota bacterium]